MATPRIVHPSHPAKPVLPQLAQQIDDLLELRALDRPGPTGRARADRAAGLTAFRGEEATATVDLRLEARS